MHRNPLFCATVPLMAERRARVVMPYWVGPILPSLRITWKGLQQYHHQQANPHFHSAFLVDTRQRSLSVCFIDLRSSQSINTHAYNHRSVLECAAVTAPLEANRKTNEQKWQRLSGRVHMSSVSGAEGCPIRYSK